MKDGTVAVVGRPNAGKSTLVNALVGKKVGIVSQRPQTTRHLLHGVVRGDGWRLVLQDTPGTHRPLHRMNRAMMEAVRAALRSCDAAALVLDASEPPGAGTGFLFDLVLGAGIPTILVANKIDRIRKEQLLPFIAKLTANRTFASVVPVSARKSEGLPVLVDELRKLMPDVPSIPATDPPPPAIDFAVAERIREALLVRCGEEIPYTTAVRIDGLDENAGPNLCRVVASIVVDRPGQKKIVVGRGGAMVKAIGTEARHEIEDLVKKRVFLDHQVIVEAGWREDERFLSELPDPERMGSSVGSADDDEDDDFDGGDEGELEDDDGGDDSEG